MNPKNELVHRTIKDYLKKKTKDEFGEDYKLIEPEMDQLTEKYNLKELIIIARVTIDKIKNRENLH